MDRSLPLTLILVVAFLVACGGGGTATPTPTEDQDADNGAAATDASGGQGAGASAGAEPTTAGQAQVSALLALRKASTFKVEYEWSGTGSTPTSETWYHKGVNSRVDWGQPGEPSYASHYVNKDGAFICEHSGSTATCFKTAGTAGSAEELSFAATIITIYEGILVDPSFAATRETRTIAGQSGSCWISGPVVMLGLAGVTICYATSSGVPLFFEWKAGNDSFAMTAKTYTGTVADSDFVLPATPTN